jgi:hypothetical protein
LTKAVGFYSANGFFINTLGVQLIAGGKQELLEKKSFSKMAEFKPNVYEKQQLQTPSIPPPSAFNF